MTAPAAPTNAPNIAYPRFSFVYENPIPPTLIARRAPAAAAFWVALSDRTLLGTATPAMNKVTSTASGSSRKKKTFCLLISPPYQPREGHSRSRLKGQFRGTVRQEGESSSSEGMTTLRRRPYLINHVCACPPPGAPLRSFFTHGKFLFVIELLALVCTTPVSP